MIEQNVKFLVRETDIEFTVSDYEINQYSYKVWIQKRGYNVEELRELLFDLDETYTVDLIDLDSNEIGTLPCCWCLAYFGLDDIEELPSTFLLTFSNTALKAKEIAKNTADIDYLAMMMDLELE